MTGKTVRFEIALSRGRLRLLLSLAAVGLCVTETASESLTLTTTYPAPFGVYNQIVTTGAFGSSKSNTVLNRDGGNTVLVPPSNAAGRVGIGTSTPAAKLEVNGDVIVEGDLILKNPAAAIYEVNPACPFGGMLSNQPGCATTICGGTETGSGASCYQTCSMGCTTQGPGASTLCVRKGPEVCENRLLGHLTK